MVFFSQEKNIWTKIPWRFFLKKKKKTDSWGDVFKTWLENTLQTLTNPYLFLSILSFQTLTNPYLFLSKNCERNYPTWKWQRKWHKHKKRYGFFVFVFCFISIRWVFCFLFRLLSIVLMYLRLWVIEYSN